MSSKKIGIVGWNIGENSFGITKAYAEFLRQYGTIHILAPQAGIVEGLDLLVLPGGADISPILSGVVPSYYTSNNDVMKEFFFKNNLPQYINAGVPVFGICLGMQQIAVHFGAKMVQHFGCAYSSESRSQPVDTLVLTKEGEQYKSMLTYTPRGSHKQRSIDVNSLHHQVVSPMKFPDCLEIVAIEKTYGNIEIIKHRTLPIWGVQYHPEEIYDYTSDQIINILLNPKHVYESEGAAKNS